jgi:hypothetical protein
MAAAMNDAESLKKLVLDELGRNARRPTELLKILGDEYSDSDALIKEVVLRLLQEHQIEMTPSQELHVVDSDDVAA